VARQRLQVRLTLKTELIILSLCPTFKGDLPSHPTCWTEGISMKKRDASRIPWDCIQSNFKECGYWELRSQWKENGAYPQSPESSASFKVRLQPLSSSLPSHSAPATPGPSGPRASLSSKLLLILHIPGKMSPLLGYLPPTQSGSSSFTAVITACTGISYKYLYACPTKQGASLQQAQSTHFVSLIVSSSQQVPGRQ
jgi:hypothetical protein